MAKRLWDKGEGVNQLMQALTVGDDPIVDLALVTHDARGSAAHARMLAKMGYLSTEDLRILLAELKAIEADEKFEIPFDLEDVHTTIENRLVERCGEAGRRIHTARSRNDQVLLALRLYMRSELSASIKKLFTIMDAINLRFRATAELPLPGYTHMQPAMPASVGMWWHALYEALLEEVRAGAQTLDLLDSHPLGSGAGFGSSLKLDRRYCGELLGFTRVQRSFIDVNNSRGRFELRCVGWMTNVASVFEKFACDIMLFQMKEFGLVSLPTELTTGSSIMPQKRNPDLVELLRGRASKLRGAHAELASLTAKLPSSYHRDFQFSKAPLVRATQDFQAVLSSAELLIESLTFNEQALADCMHAELYATYDANREVLTGKPFRDAYRAVAERIKRGDIDVARGKIEFEIPQSETRSGMELAVKDRVAEEQALASYFTRVDVALSHVFDS